MKKTCDGCRALYISWRHIGLTRSYCNLGYKQKEIYKIGLFKDAIPLENCPKPRTWKEYDKLPMKK